MLKFQGKVTDTNGNPIAAARLTVSTENVVTPLPVVFTIQTDGSVIAGANPLLTDANGEYVFAIASGSYSIAVTGSSAVLNISKTITEYTIPVITATTVTPVTYQSVTYITNGNFTALSDFVTVTALGGGAGGTSAGTDDAGTGGGAGATVVRFIPVIKGNIYAIGIGGGGLGAVGSSGTTGTIGTDGGDTTFGSLVLAGGGLGNGAGGRGFTGGFGGPTSLSVTANTSQSIYFGRGGICAGGDGGAPGGIGGSGASGFAPETYPAGLGGAGRIAPPQMSGGGGGGASVFGGGGKGGHNITGAATGGSGLDGTGYGSGGGGGATGGTTGGNSGAGMPGLCIVEWIS